MEYILQGEVVGELNWTFKGRDKKGNVKIEKYFKTKEKGLEFANELKQKGITNFSLKSTSAYFYKVKKGIKKGDNDLSRKLSFKD